MNEISNDYPDTIHIEWVLSNVCNYKCNYCIPSLNNGSSGQPNIDDALRFFNYVHDKINSNAKMLTISGGEPTLWPDLVNFLNSLDSSYYTAIVTNGSRTLRWWNDFVSTCHNIHRASISVHLQYADVDHIINLCKILENKIRVTVMIMFDKLYQHKLENFLNRLTDENLKISITVKPVNIRDQGNISQNYTNEEKKLIQNFKYEKINLSKLPIATHLVIDGEERHIFYTNELISNNLHTFKGWYCEIGLKRLVINYDGTIYPAQCQTAKQLPLGNMKDKVFKKIEGAICSTNYCDCAPEIRIPKRRIIKIKSE